jgi:hypothetical protein
LSRSLRKDEVAFAEMVRLIDISREKALQVVNTSLIELYWQVGEIISHKVKAAEWGSRSIGGVYRQDRTGVARLYAQKPVPHEAVYGSYRGDSIVSPLVA